MESYVTPLVLPVSLPLGAVFGMLPEIFAHNAWPAVSLASSVAGPHIGGKF